METVRIGVFSDSHSKHAKLKVEPCDILICAGDISMMGYQYEVEDFLDWYGQQPAPTKYLVAGNHDWSFQEKPDWWSTLIFEAGFQGITYLEDRVVSYLTNGGRPLKIYGSPWQPEFHNWAFNLPRGEKLKEKWAMIPKDTDILITHGPPYGILDEIPPHFCKKGQDPHVGCEDLTRRIKELPNLKYHIFGHIHVDNEPKISTWEEGGKVFINATVVDNRYHLIRHEPFYFELEV